MNETFDDNENYIFNNEQNPVIIIRNYDEIINKYGYSDYVNEFRSRAEADNLSVSQRPKLDSAEFLVIKKDLKKYFKNFIENETIGSLYETSIPKKITKKINKILVEDKFDSDYIVDL